MNLEKFQILHRLTGFTVILFLLFFAATGMLLNHSDQLHMDKRYLDYNWLLWLYSIGPTQQPVAYTADGTWLVRIDNHLYFNERELPLRAESLLGLVKSDGVYIAALPDILLLLNGDGEIIEKITPLNGLPGGLQKLGKLDEELFIIATAKGLYVNHTNLDGWREISAPITSWSMPEQLPEAKLRVLLSLYRGSGLTLERALLDLHSGRLLGRWKIIIVDVVALLLIISALSGVSMWYKKKKLLTGLK